MDIFTIISMLGGLGLFLYGMKFMGDGLELAAGSRLKNILSLLTTNRLVGTLVGLVVTVIIQSSSATSVMVVGFVNAGLLTLNQAVGILMGANIGTTITGQLIAFKIGDYAPIFIFIGVIFLLFINKQTYKHIGQIICGFGLLFLGLEIMSGSMAPLADIPQFQSMLTAFKNPFMGILVGAVFTGIIQSSSASIGVLQALALTPGLMTIESAIYVLLGMNIGTCVTALISSIGTSKAARRTAIVHLLFNIIGVIIFVPVVAFLPFNQWIEALSPGDVARQIANAHTIFNIATTIVLLPCATLLTKLACLIIPGEDKKYAPMKLQFIDERFMRTPSVAVGQVKKEVERLAILARTTMYDAFDCIMNHDKEKIETVLINEQTIDYIENGITTYMIKLNSFDLDEHDTQLLGKYFHVVNDLERIGDHAENIVEAIQKMEDQKLKFSQTAYNELQEMISRIEFLLDESLHVLRTQEYDKELDFQIRTIEQEIDDLTRANRDNHVKRLAKGKCSSAQGILFLDMLVNLERVTDHATNIALNMEEV